MQVFLAILFIVLFVAVVVVLRRGVVFDKGKRGERRVQQILEQLSAENYFVFNDLILKRGNGKTAQIDHVVVSRYGIFVIETKNYQGKVYGSEWAQYWTQYLNGQGYDLYNPVKQNDGHIWALREYLYSLGDLPFVSIVAFSPYCELKVTVKNAYVLYWDDILLAVGQYEHERIEPAVVARIVERLQEAEVNDTEARKEHRRYVRNRYGN